MNATRHPRTGALRSAVRALAAAALVTGGSAHANLDISQEALEQAPPVEPNVVILNDDSGSMDWEALTRDADNDFLFSGSQPDGSSATGDGDVKHRDSDDDGAAECGFGSGTFYGYLYGVEFGSNTYMDSGLDCNTADDESWRFRNSEFNRIYFDPARTYEPWAGLDASGSEFTDIDPANAPDNPYDPNETINLLTDNSNWQGAGLARLQSDRDGDGSDDGFRFYTWTDIDTDNNFDDGEQTEYQVGNVTDTELTNLNQWLVARHGAGAKQYATAAELQQNFANWFGYYRKREFTAKAALSRVIRDTSGARIGYGTINRSSLIELDTMNVSTASGAKRELLDALYATNSFGGTPLRRNLETIGNYYACDSSAETSRGSYFGDGATCPVKPVSDGGACQQNYAILMTDGFYTGGDPDALDNEDNSDGDFSGGAFGDSYPETLADVAMYFYKTDLHPNKTNQVPTTERDRNLYRGAGELGETMHQHMGTYTIGFGVDGNITAMPADKDDSSFDWWSGTAGENKINDLRHAAYNGRGQYLSAGNPTQLANALNGVMEEIQSGVGSGSSVAFNTQNIRTESLVFRAFYDTKTDTGDLIAQRVRADGTVDTTTDVWSAATQLDAQTADSSDSRRVVTFDHTTGAGTPFRWTDLTASQQSRLHTPNPGSVTDTDRTDNGGIGDERLNWVRGHAANEGPETTTGDLRDRPVLEGRLGDITHSAPVFVGEPEFTGRVGGAWPDGTTGDTYPEFKQANATRNGIVYVGANDGMLHAFRSEAWGGAPAGSEVFAYVPDFLVDGLPTLASPDYTHRFFVDATPAINDAYMPALGGWRTVLIGGAGAGGKGYFALDITDPAGMTDETQIANRVLWEFTSADDSDLGYTFSEPVIAMSNLGDGNGDQQWVAIFGNGYNAASVDGNAKLFVVFIEKGADGSWDVGDYIELDTGVGFDEINTTTMPHLSPTTPNGIGGIRAVDFDRNGTVDYVYAGDLQGNLYRFDLTSSNASQWNVAGKLFQATYSDGTVQPLTKAPIVTPHPNTGETGLIVSFGTGSWMTSGDRTDTHIQSLYGIWDNFENLSATPTVTRDFLVEQEFMNQIDPIGGFVVRTSTDYEVDWQDNGSNQTRGWYYDFDMPPANGADGDPAEFPGERAVRNLQLRGGVLFVNTIIPGSSNVCIDGPGGFELAVNPRTGGTPEQVVFDVSGDGVFDVSDNVDGTSGQVNQVTGVRFEGGVPTDSGFIEDVRITQVGDEIRSMKTNTGGEGPIGRHSWREVIPD